MTTPWTASSPGARFGAAGTVTLVDGNTFMVSAPSGDLVSDGIEGLYMLDTRVLSRWAVTIDGEPVEAISAATDGPFSARLVARGQATGNAESDLAVIRARHVGRGLREDLQLRHYGLTPRHLVLTLHLASDFASLFDVKAGRTGTPTTPEPVLDDDGVLTVASTGPAPVDGLRIRFDHRPDRVEIGFVEWDIELAPSGTFTLCTEVGVQIDGEDLRCSYPCGEPIEQAIPINRLASWQAAVPRILSDDTATTRAANRAVTDLGSLRIFDPRHAERVVVAAGAPWFMTLFGRDSLFTAWMALLVDHDLAHGVLSSLTDTQGRHTRPETEEQPGRILHEVRYDHTSARLLGGSNIYYGTADATPLFVMLVAELARWTGQRSVVEPFLGAVDRAVTWIETLGDPDGDGFIDYARSTDTGLANQGWKDSWDGIRHADGTIPDAPIALCEVQAYAYAALRGRADLARLSGDSATAATYDTRADDLRHRFDEAFWLPDHGWYAVGLDGDKNPIGSLTSNIGHCLWTGIATPDRAATIAGHLTSPDLFTGWGVRTLSATNPGYNPLSYHCGSVWPHDTAIAVAGLARYGHDDAVAALYRGLIDTAAAGDGRLPELFAGFDRADLPTPVPYPSSCSPQAWSAASPLLLLRSILGLRPDLINDRLDLRPRLPDGIDRLVVDGLPLGTTRIRIEIGPDGLVDVDGLPDGIDLTIT